MKRKKRLKNDHINESWLLPYADMLTLLVALFIVLFAMSEIDKQKYEELSQVFKNEFSDGGWIFPKNEPPVNMPNDVPSKPITKKHKENKGLQEISKLRAIQKRIDTYITENSLSDELKTKLTAEGLLITILNDVTFDSASARVKENGKQVAKEIAAFIYTDPPHQIVVSGHTDSRPIHNKEFSSNWELSVIRAVNFTRLLLQNEKLDPERFSAKGFGEHHPIVPNNSKQNRAKNRRVEVLILPNHKIDAAP